MKVHYETHTVQVIKSAVSWEGGIRGARGWGLSYQILYI